MNEEVMRLYLFPNSSRMIKFIYVWRLCKEKGCDLILDFFNSLNSALLQSVQLDIYGDGVLRHEFEQLGQKMDNVTYHGYISKDIILENWKDADYTLMPSRFLETFGLSALDSFGVWVPVVWFRKWWLEQFGECIIDIWSEENFWPTLLSLMENNDQTDNDMLSKKCSHEFSKYSKELRLDRCRQFVWSDLKWKKILLASDYIVKLWGIETYILDVKELLESQWAEVRLVWSDVVRHGWKRYLAMLYSLCNYKFGRKIQHIDQERKPDIVWWHSVHRWIGWLPLWMMRNSKSTQCVMYHDFWLFHPVPSDVYDEDQLWYPKTLRWYIWASKKTWISLLLRIPLLCVKWWSCKSIWKLLRKISLHMVPSVYMEKRVTRMWIEQERVKTLPHFV